MRLVLRSRLAIYCRKLNLFNVGKASSSREANSQILREPACHGELGPGQDPQGDEYQPNLSYHAYTPGGEGVVLSGSWYLFIGAFCRSIGTTKPDLRFPTSV